MLRPVEPSGPCLMADFGENSELYSVLGRPSALMMFSC